MVANSTAGASAAGTASNVSVTQATSAQVTKAVFSGGADAVFGNENGDTIVVTFDGDVSGLDFTSDTFDIDSDGPGAGSSGGFTIGGVTSSSALSGVATGNTLTLTVNDFLNVTNDETVTVDVSTITFSSSTGVNTAGGTFRAS